MWESDEVPRKDVAWRRVDWVGAADFFQHIARFLVFNLLAVLRRKSLRCSFPPPPNSLFCMGGLDVVVSSTAPSSCTSSFNHRFSLACDQLKLLFHAGK